MPLKSQETIGPIVDIPATTESNAFQHERLQHSFAARDGGLFLRSSIKSTWKRWCISDSSEPLLLVHRSAAERCCPMTSRRHVFRTLIRLEIGRHFCRMSRLLLFLRISWLSLAGCGAGEEEVAFAGVAGKCGGAFELGAGFEVAA